MFDDPQKELKRLESQLLKDSGEDWLDKELDQIRAILGDEPQEAPQPPVRNFANGYLEDYSREIYADEEAEPAPPRHRGIKGLVILALLEMAGIAGIIFYWVRMML